MTHINPNLDQDSFRGRNDDGSESTATWKANANTNWTQAVDETFRVRFLVQEDAGGTENNVSIKLQYNLNSAGWNDVTASSSVVQMVNTANLTEGNDTTQQIGAGTFITDNNWVEDNDGTTGNCSFAGNDEAEAEFACQILSADVADSDTVQLRVIHAGGTVLETYTNTPSVTVSEGGQTFTQSASVTTVNVIGLVKGPGLIRPVTVAAAPSAIRKVILPAKSITTANVVTESHGLLFTQAVSAVTANVPGLSQIPT